MSSQSASMWEPALGAITGPDGVRFRVWAPKPSKVELVLLTDEGERTVPMARDGEYWVAHLPDAGADARYKYRLDGGQAYPDPASRSQPQGVHGPSEVVDASSYAWNDSAWKAPAPWDLSIYECHVGTMTPEGTFDAAIGQLDRLKELGLTAIELMPVAAFDGRWNWGYDGVALFAPAAVYGGAEGLRRLVDAAHARGLAVLLDVVYNHFGPSGNYTALYSDHYLTSKHHTAWGDALNFDDLGSEHVRRFFIENLLHWVHEYHVDGFRLDATWAIQDESPTHILAELTQALLEHPRTDRKPYMIAETHENDVRYLRPVEEGGHGFDAVWADDFHHLVRTNITHERGGYYAAYEGTVVELGSVIEQGFYYEGQVEPRRGHRRGTRAREQPWYQFVYAIQNHDQVGNRAFGERLSFTASHADFLAATALLLLLPQTPLIFQGQEFMASTPFLYFTDHEPELGKLVTEGRRKEFGGFAAFSDPALVELIPDPQDPRTFELSKLRPEEMEYGAGRLCLTLYRTLLELRMSDPVLRESRSYRSRLGTRTGRRSVLARLETGSGRRLIATNFGEWEEVEYPGAGKWKLDLHTHEPRFGGSGLEPEPRQGSIVLPPHCTVFLKGAG